MADEKPNDKKTNLAAANLGRDILKSMKDQLNQVQKPWFQLLEKEQEQVIKRMRDDVDVMVKKVVATIMTGEFAAVKGFLHQCSIQDGIKCNINVDGDAKHRHQLVDATKSTVLIVMADAEQYLETMGEVIADSEQPDLFEASTEQTTEKGSDMPPVATGAAPINPDEGLDESAEIQPEGQYVPRGTQNQETAESSPPQTPDAAESGDDGGIEDGEFTESSPPDTQEPQLEADPGSSDGGVNPKFLVETLQKIGFTVPIETVHSWNEELRVQALTFFNDTFEAQQLGDKKPNVPFYLVPYK